MEFKQWGMWIQIEQQQETDIILHLLLVKLFAAAKRHFFYTFKQHFWTFEHSHIKVFYLLIELANNFFIL